VWEGRTRYLSCCKYQQGASHNHPWGFPLLECGPMIQMECGVR
jgi:hypothetical protein